MKTVISRCAHCGAQYTHSYSSTGIIKYCPECQKEVDNGLASIPVKFEGRFREIVPTQEELEKIDKIRNLKDNESDEIILIPLKLAENSCYKHNEHIIIDHIQYTVRWNNDREKSYWRKDEYDLKKDMFTDNPWTVDKCSDYYYASGFLVKDSVFCTSDLVPETKMTMPDGKLFYNDLK